MLAQSVSCNPENTWNDEARNPREKIPELVVRDEVDWRPRRGLCVAYSPCMSPSMSFFSFHCVKNAARSSGRSFAVIPTAPK